MSMKCCHRVFTVTVFEAIQLRWLFSCFQAFQIHFFHVINFFVIISIFMRKMFGDFIWLSSLLIWNYSFIETFILFTMLNCYFFTWAILTWREEKKKNNQIIQKVFQTHIIIIIMAKSTEKCVLSRVWNLFGFVIWTRAWCDQNY